MGAVESYMAVPTSGIDDGFERTIGLNDHRRCTTCSVKVVSKASAKPNNSEAVGYVSVATHECGDGGDARIAGNPAASADERGGRTPIAQYSWEEE